MEGKVGFRNINPQRVRVSEIRPLEVVLARCRRQSFDFDLLLAVTPSVEQPKFLEDEDHGDGQWKQRTRYS